MCHEKNNDFFLSWFECRCISFLKLWQSKKHGNLQKKKEWTSSLSFQLLLLAPFCSHQCPLAWSLLFPLSQVNLQIFQTHSYLFIKIYWTINSIVIISSFFTHFIDLLMCIMVYPCVLIKKLGCFCKSW